MSSSKSRNVEKELKGMSISLEKFLILYCGVPESVVLGRKVSHNDIKTLIPDLKRIGFDTLMKNKRDLYVGNIIVVMDSYGNIAPYITPEIKFRDESFEVEQYDAHSNCREEKIKNVILNENLSRYELVLLTRYFKKHGRVDEYRAATRLLKIKKDEDNVKKYMKEKFELRMKGREVYEKF